MHPCKMELAYTLGAGHGQNEGFYALVIFAPGADAPLAPPQLQCWARSLL